VAIGETGLDFFRDRSPRSAQTRAFTAQVALARRLRKPVLVHCRDAHAETLALLAADGPLGRGGIMHFFSGALTGAWRCIALRRLVPRRAPHAQPPALLAADGPLARGGIIHCFSGDLTVARRCIELGPLVSLAGPVTYPRPGALPEVARTIPADRLVVETDCPFLPPQPY